MRNCGNGKIYKNKFTLKIKNNLEKKVNILRKKGDQNCLKFKF